MVVFDEGELVVILGYALVGGLGVESWHQRVVDVLLFLPKMVTLHAHHGWAEWL